MDKNRRKFLKLTGLAALGLTTGKLTDTFAKESLLKNPAFEAVPKNSIFSDEGSGKRYAMVVDLRKCLEKGQCTKCLDACHTAHNVPDMGNKKDEVKWIWREDFEHVFHDQENHYLNDNLKGKKIPVLCNHCDNPPCVKVCPTQATWKREDGIVMMDWHRCIGCRYCVAACPYGSRSFNWKDPRPYIKKITPEFPTRTKGVVEKCTFCDERLAKGQMPSCTEACTDKALIFGDLNDSHSEIREILKENFSIRRKPGLGTNPEIYYIV